MVRNVSINNEKVNRYLDSLPKRTRSYYIEQSILLNIEFNNGEYIRKDEIESLINTVISKLNKQHFDNTNTTINETNSNSICSSIKDSISNILSL